jgi:hypothetical protein
MIESDLNRVDRAHRSLAAERIAQLQEKIVASGDRGDVHRRPVGRCAACAGACFGCPGSIRRWTCHNCVSILTLWGPLLLMVCRGLSTRRREGGIPAAARNLWENSIDSCRTTAVPQFTITRRSRRPAATRRPRSRRKQASSRGKRDAVPIHTRVRQPVASEQTEETI